MNRALDYAHAKGVTLVGGAGQQPRGPRQPADRRLQPGLPARTPPTRARSTTRPASTCPVEGPHVIGVSALGPSGKKADYSNYGVEQISVSAPGGWFRDGFGRRRYRTNGNQILSTYPLNVLQEEGSVDASGNITTAGIARRRHEGLRRQHLRLLRVPPGHLDGVAARDGRRRARGQPVRREGPAAQGRPAARALEDRVRPDRTARPSTPARSRRSPTTPTRPVRPSSTRSAKGRRRSTASTATASWMPTPP